MTGTGTQTDPYIITTADELYEMDTLGGASVYFKLGADIDFNGTAYAENYVSIPLKCKELDGDGHVIRNICATNMSGVASAFTIYNTATSSDIQTIKNLTLEGVYLKGNKTYFFASYNASGTLVLSNCKIICRFTATTAFLNGTYDYNCLMRDGARYIQADLCTFVLTADLQLPFPILAKGTASRCQFRLNISILNSDSGYSHREAFFYYTTMNDCYFFGELSQTLGTGDEGIVFAVGNTHSNCYQVIEYKNLKNALWNATIGSTCFYDNEAKGSAFVSNTAGTSYNPDLLYGLTTEQCKDAEYLKSIGFMCEGAD